MAFTMTLWEVQEEKLVELSEHKLDTEERLESWIEKDNTLLGLDLLIIGRQVRTQFRGQIDLLGIDQEGDIVIIELKRNRTPREIVAQILDYASWVSGLAAREIDELASDYLGARLSQVFRERFNTALPENINSGHRMLIVASELDDSSERIVQYLSSEHSLDINVVFFHCFKQDGKELVGRSWLMDPVEVGGRAGPRRRLHWSGFWFVNVGEGPHRNWDDCRKHGFLSAGQGKKYSDPLKKLGVDDKVFAYMKGLGYVGYGEVTQEAVMTKDFYVGEQRLLDLSLKQPNMRDNSENPELSDWVIGVRWLKAYQRDEAQKFPGIFANPNIVCKIRDEQTLEFLQREFNVEAGAEN